VREEGEAIAMKHFCPMCGEQWDDDVCAACGWREGKKTRYTARKNPHAVALGRKGGLAGKGITSRKKAAAARRNGKKGGRPKKQP
jgi:uncharacterized membrane protein YvbJ